ncbi:MAG: UDP-N-acetylmuramoyl-L-alanine--D-glutamate ligase [Clostridia bacterium]|nr:UDP-N-acetylmuramoyl-L-alanine--D-glutamate ligase [Clostridia bacterium]
MYPKKQIFFVLGLSRSGRAATEFLLSRNAITYIYDDLWNERIEQVAADLEKRGAKRVLKEDLPKMKELCDVLVLSPGIPIDHPVAVAFKRARKAVVGETELAARYMRAPIIAITGTNGKTTTVSLLRETLEKGGLTAYACGNIGTPMLECIDAKNDEVAVAEISSFQLETLNSICPHISIVLNVTEDHLNRHYNMENYVFLKAKLLKNQTETEYVILNYDDPIVRGFAEKTRANVLYFSVRERVRGAFYENDWLYFGKERIMPISELSMGGLHNVQNALAVIIAAKLMGVRTEEIVSALKNFKGIKHRIECIGEVNGVRFVDDSKGTNVDATIKAVTAMKTETVLLLGGKNKGYDYDKLFSHLIKSKVCHAVLYGENRYALLKSAQTVGFDRLSLCDTFAFAVKIAAMKAENGQTVLLSPASASFDEFSSYEERGDKFAEIVAGLKQRAQGQEVQDCAEEQEFDDGEYEGNEELVDEEEFEETE